MQARIKDKELGVPNKIRFSLVLYAEPRETAALDKRSVFPQVNSQGSGRNKDS